MSESVGLTARFTDIFADISLDSIGAELSL